MDRPRPNDASALRAVEEMATAGGTLLDAEARGAAGRAGIDPTVLEALLWVLDEEDHAQLIRHGASDIAASAAGLTAACREGDLTTAVRQSHTLMSLAATIGATSLAARARALHESLRAGRTRPEQVQVDTIDDLARRASAFLGGLALGHEGGEG